MDKPGIKRNQNWDMNCKTDPHTLTGQQLAISNQLHGSLKLKRIIRILVILFGPLLYSLTIRIKNCAYKYMVK